MRILLIYPTSSLTFNKAYLPPLILAQLAGLTPKRHEVVVVNDAIDPIPYDGDFDLVCLSAMTVQATRAYQIAKRFRKRGIPVIIGGFHTSVLPDDAVSYCDSVVIGEVEDFWNLILLDAEKGALKSLYQCDRFDLQRQVIPRWDLFDLKKYERIPWLKLPIMPIYTTRGCPMGCDYCSVTLIHGKKMRHRPVEHVAEEFDSLNHVKSRFYFIVDDNITGDYAYSKELFKMLSGKQPDINWFGQISTSVLNTPDLIPLMAKAGCSSIFIGVESLNQTTLDSMKKKNRVEKYKELFDRLYSVGIVPFLSIMFGFDDDTEETFEESISFHVENDIMLSAWWMLSPAPGTPFCSKMEEENRILERRWSKYDAINVLIKPKNFELKDFVNMYWESYRKYFSFTDQINARVKGKHKNLTHHNYMGAKFIQSLAKKQVMNNLHPFAMGSI